MPKTEVKIYGWVDEPSASNAFHQGDVIVRKHGSYWVVERDIPYTAKDLPTELGSVVMVKNGQLPYVWERSYEECVAPQPWAQAGTSIYQTNEQLIIEANRWGSLEILYVPGKA